MISVVEMVIKWRTTALCQTRSYVFVQQKAKFFLFINPESGLKSVFEND